MSALHTLHQLTIYLLGWCVITTVPTAAIMTYTEGWEHPTTGVFARIAFCTTVMFLFFLKLMTLTEAGRQDIRTALSMLERLKPEGMSWPCAFVMGLLSLVLLGIFVYMTARASFILFP